MTEAEWLMCAEPNPMLDFLRRKISDRKLRLFAVACCRRIWHRFTDERSRKAVTGAEQYADGMISREECKTAQQEATVVARANPSSAVCYAAVAAATNATEDDEAVFCAAWNTGSASAPSAFLPQELISPDIEKRQKEEELWQASLLRDIFGTLLFRPVTLTRSWLTPTVTSLANAVYGDRQMPSGAFDNLRMGVLADALEEAGCDTQDVLDHCRNGGDHFRGCWLVDLVLGKG